MTVLGVGIETAVLTDLELLLATEPVIMVLPAAQWDEMSRMFISFVGPNS